MLLRRFYAGLAFPVFFVLSAVYLVVLSLVFGLSVLDPETFKEATAASITVAVGSPLLAELTVVFVGWLILRTSEFKRILCLVKPRLNDVSIGVIAGMTLFASLQLVANVMARYGFKNSSSETSSFLGDSTGLTKIILLCLVVPIIIPIAEELFFRGTLIGFITNIGLPQKLGVVIAVITSMITFGVVHIQGLSSFNDFFVLGWISFVGLVNALLFVWRKNLVTPVLSHIAYNGLTVLSLLFL